MNTYIRKNVKWAKEIHKKPWRKIDGRFPPIPIALTRRTAQERGTPVAG